MIQQPTLWTVVHRSGAGANLIPMLSVRLSDGTIWSGDVAAVGHFEARADSEVALGGDIEVVRNGQRVRLAKPWARVVLPLASVDEILVAWRMPRPGETRLEIR